MAKRGRHTKKTNETMDRVIQAIEMGATRKVAVLYAGIGESTLYEMLNEFPDFAERLKASEGKRAVRWLSVIERAAQDGSWQAAAWKLERTMPDEYGRKTRTEVTGKDEGPVQLEHSGAVELNDVLSKLSPDVLSALATAIDEADGEEPEEAA